MRFAYIITLAIAAITSVLVLYGTTMENVNMKVTKWVQRTLAASMGAEVTSIFITLPEAGRWLVMVAYAFYFIAYDWISVSLLGFAFSYGTNTEGKQKRIKWYMAIVYILAIADSMNILLNLIFEHAYTYEMVEFIDGDIYPRFVGIGTYNLHLAFVYAVLGIVFVVLIRSILGTVSFYRLKYIIPMVVILVLAIINTVYVMFNLPVDWSIITYSIACILLYYYSAKYIPSSLKDKTLKETTDELIEGIILFDIYGNCIYTNATVEKFFAIPYAAASIDTFPVKEWIDESNLEKIEPFEKVFSFGDGDETKHFNINFTHVTDRSGARIGSYFIVNDITEAFNAMVELDKARKEAMQASTAKGAFLANMSHEIRTPINAILGMNEMILRENCSPEIREFAENIHTSGEALLSLINDILDFSKIESGKMELQNIEYSPFEIIRSCQTMIAGKADAKNLKLIIECDENCPKKLYGDEVRIRQVITNILTNAVKYTESGSVTIRLNWSELCYNGGILEISVQDTGIGIRKDDIEKMFNAFERVDEDRNRNIEGTGLGMSITNQLVKLMRGELHVESEYGVGSTFSVQIPQIMISSEKSGSFETKSVNVRKEYKELFTAPEAKILAVDDYKMNLVVLKGLLKRTKVQVTTAKSGEEALALIQMEHFDLILMDHMMPQMDGIETFERMRQMETMNSETPVIMLTANAVSGAEKEYLLKGFTDYLSKPIDGERLEQTLLKYLPTDKLTLGDGGV